MAGTSKQKTEKEQVGIEESFAALEEIIKSLESGEDTLEEAFASYEKGIKLVKALNGQLDQVEKQIMILNEGEEHE